MSRARSGLAHHRRAYALNSGYRGGGNNVVDNCIYLPSPNYTIPSGFTYPNMVIPNGKCLCIRTGETLTVNTDGTLLCDGICINNNGTISNNGNFINTNNGSITNNGTIQNEVGGIFTTENGAQTGNVGNILNSGTMNQNSGVIFNSSTITNLETGIINNDFGGIANVVGVMVGVIDNSGGTIINTNNGGMIISPSTILNNSGTIDISNNGVIVNGGTLHNNTGSTIDIRNTDGNSGEQYPNGFANDSGLVNNYGSITSHEDCSYSLYNYNGGTINNMSGGNITIALNDTFGNFSSFYNTVAESTVTNNGTFNNGTFDNSGNAVISNSGTFDNNKDMVNYGTVINSLSSNFNDNSNSSFENYGSITNVGTFTNSNITTPNPYNSYSSLGASIGGTISGVQFNIV